MSVNLAPLQLRDSHLDLEHGGELRLHFSARDRAGLFVQAMQALTEIVEGENGVNANEQGEPLGRIVVEARDPPALLVAWLNELLYLAEVRGVVPTECTIESLSDERVVAELRGQRLRRFRPIVKAATYSGLHLSEAAGLAQATVVLDV